MMTANIQEHNAKRIHPQKFALMIACASIMMMFAALTSAYVVRQASGNWLEFELPSLFYMNTITALVTSGLIYLSERNFKREEELYYKIFLIAAFITGALFIVFQYMAWLQMSNEGIQFAGNPSGSFVYVISGLHAAHVIGGLVAMLVAIIQAFALPFYVSKERIKRLNLTSSYWHFVCFLWIYLLIFFIIQN